MKSDVRKRVKAVEDVHKSIQGKFIIFEYSFDIIETGYVESPIVD